MSVLIRRRKEKQFFVTETECVLCDVRADIGDTLEERVNIVLDRQVSVTWLVTSGAPKILSGRYNK